GGGAGGGGCYLDRRVGVLPVGGRGEDAADVPQLAHDEFDEFDGAPPDAEVVTADDTQDPPEGPA
ncbi:MAG: hypothetical protein LH468_12765, partial [Nocardioides sp.]|nr:hypothetical protein [Nocardioides sp.]